MRLFARGFLHLEAKKLEPVYVSSVAKLLIGDVSERPKVQLSKSCVGESPPWVQIPPSPPVFIANCKLGQAGIH